MARTLNFPKSELWLVLESHEEGLKTIETKWQCNACGYITTDGSSMYLGKIAKHYNKYHGGPWPPTWIIKTRSIKFVPSDLT